VVLVQYEDLWKKNGANSANSANFQPRNTTRKLLLHTQTWFQFEKQMKGLKTRFASSRDR
jgi:hypothetical protein